MEVSHYEYDHDDEDLYNGDGDDCDQACVRDLCFILHHLLHPVQLLLCSQSKTLCEVL